MDRLAAAGRCDCGAGDGPNDARLLRVSLEMIVTKRKAAQAMKSYLAARDQGKAAYARADAILEDLAASLKPGAPVAPGAGRTPTLVDQFAEKTKVYKPCGISRFEVKVITG